MNWKRAAIFVGIPGVIVCAAVAAWRFCPQVPLPPEKSISILDRASSGPLAFNDGGTHRKKLLLMSGNEIWEIPSGTPYAKIPNQQVTLSADGRRVLSYGAIFKLDSNTTIPLQNPDPQWMSVPTGNIPIRFNHIEFSNAGTLIAVSRQDGSLYLFDSATGEAVRTLRQGITAVPPAGEPCYITSSQFSPDDGILASGELNGYVSLWNTSTGDLVGTLPSPDNEACDQSGRQIPNPASSVRALGFSPKGDLLASIDGFGILRVWNITSHKLLRTLPFHLPNSAWSEVKFSPDGHFLVSYGTTPQGGMILIWDADRGQLLRGIGLSGAARFDFTPRGNLAVAQSNVGRVKVQLWQMDTRLSLPFGFERNEAPGATDPALIQAYEDEALNHLAWLQDRLGAYLSKGKGTFPSTLDELGAQDAFEKAIFSKKELGGYRYVYAPGKANGQGNILSYTIAANPLIYQHAGTRSFLLEQSGQVHAIAQNRVATSSDPMVRSFSDATQTAMTAPSVQGDESTTAQSGNAGQSLASGARSVPAKPSVQSNAEADQWISRAETQFQQSDFRGALQSCETALRLDPGNLKAAQLQNKVQETMKILGKN